MDQQGDDDLSPVAKVMASRMCQRPAGDVRSGRANHRTLARSCLPQEPATSHRPAPAPASATQHTPAPYTRHLQILRIQQTYAYIASWLLATPHALEKH